MENVTPMLRQYRAVKDRYPDCILFFRLGDFYEMFGEDARTASGLLDLVLTSRDGGRSGKFPMCGVPHHAADAYIARLVKAGLKVAVCEQMEDPALAKGIVERDVIRVVTAGTFLDEQSPDARYILCLAFGKDGVGAAFTDTAGGAIQCAGYPADAGAVSIMARLPVCECVFPAGDGERARRILEGPVARSRGVAASPFEDWCFNADLARKTLSEHFGTAGFEGFGVADLPLAVTAAGALLEYLRRMNKTPMRHIVRLSRYAEEDGLYISPAACRGLEMEELFRTLDETEGAMGRRTLRGWLFRPLADVGAVARRQDAVGLLRENEALREAVGRELKGMPDAEKLLSRVSCGLGAGRDLLGLRNALARIPALREALAPAAAANPLFVLADIPEIRTLLERAIDPAMPLSHAEGKTIRAGYNAELDELRDLQSNARERLRELQAREIRRTGINSLKVAYNKVFGYYIEISKPNLPLVPEEYIRKQTLVNAERFVTPELKEFEEKMLSAEEKVLSIESALLRDVQERVLGSSAGILAFAADAGRLDALLSLARTALRPGYVRPRVTGGPAIDIREGRHPVVEALSAEPFTPNDALVDCSENGLLVITGPNMAGKSTYIRQVAILVILAQAGSWIPAASAEIGVADKVFTRIGAHDDISKGQSTFMVEMSEAAEILNNLTPRSLVVLDEIGRGTSTFDGLSLAWAVAEHLQARRVRTFFATHFHELTGLADRLPGVKNYNVAVREWKDGIVFLHKIVPGGTDDSYGIYVAKLAGIPAAVIRRSQEILARIEVRNDLKERIAEKIGEEAEESLFSEAHEEIAAELESRVRELEALREDLEGLDPDAMTPLEALTKLAEMRKRCLESPRPPKPPPA